MKTVPRPLSFDSSNAIAHSHTHTHTRAHDSKMPPPGVPSQTSSLPFFMSATGTLNIQSWGRPNKNFTTCTPDDKLRDFLFLLYLIQAVSSVSPYQLGVFGPVFIHFSIRLQPGLKMNQIGLVQIHLTQPKKRLTIQFYCFETKFLIQTGLTLSLEEETKNNQSEYISVRSIMLILT